MKIKSSPHRVYPRFVLWRSRLSVQNQKADKQFNKYHHILRNTPIATAISSSGLIEVDKILNAISYSGVV